MKKVTASETRVFVYNAGGELVSEYSTLTPNGNPVTRYMTSDQLGSPRVLTDQSGSVLSRRDFLPFGEEAMIGTGPRAVGQGYTFGGSGGDSTRQKFTGYERDEETNLDFAQARTFNKNHGRFTTTDPLLTTGRPFNPKTWNRYSYTLNNPLRFTDPTGLYECSGTAEQCKTFQGGLDSARAKLADIEKKYTKDSDEYRDAVRSLDAYGEAGKANGVTVKFDTLNKGTLGKASGRLDDNGNKSITVTIDLAQNKSSSNLIGTIAHEGSHAQDYADYQDALINAGKTDSGDGSKVMAVLNGSLNITHRASETRAYGVSSVFAQFTLGGASKEGGVTSEGGTTTWTFQTEPVKSTDLGGESVWKSSWANLDKEKIRANRSAAIQKGLPKDARYAPNLDKRIQ
ncbi:MAG: RHS repeat-associated core domain-containing protein [Pyrinomonadaceae bacterium]